MIRKAIEWVLIRLGLIRKEPVNPIQALLGLVPIIYAAMTIVAMVKSFGPLHISWHRRLQHSLRYWCHKFRVVVIGY